MFRQVFRVALVVLVAVGGVAVATAAEPKQADGKTKSPPKELTVDLGKGVQLKMVLIPAGEFKMGSGESAEATAAFFNKTYGEDLVQADWFKDEHPQHRVRITKPFYLGAYHVTRGQFRQFVADTAYKTDAEKGEKPGAYGWAPDGKEFGFNEKYSWQNAGFEQTDEHPVVNVSWNDAVEFCKWLSKKESKTYRLPTEAEWEYACRAGTTTRYYSGDDPETLATVGNVADAAAKAQFPDWTWTIKANDGHVFTSPVGKFKPNAFGLYDMHGNAWQWCADWYGRNTTPSPPQTTQPAQTPAMAVSFVAVPGASGRTTPVPPFVAGTPQASGATTQGSVLPGLSNSVASCRVTVCGLALFPFTPAAQRRDFVAHFPLREQSPCPATKSYRSSAPSTISCCG